MSPHIVGRKSRLSSIIRNKVFSTDNTEYTYFLYFSLMRKCEKLTKLWAGHNGLSVRLPTGARDLPLVVCPDYI